MAERSVVIRLKGDISDFTSKMRQAGASARSALGGELGKIARQNRADLDHLGSQAGKVGLVAAAGFGVAVGAAANFGEAMSHVAATGDDARQNLDRLREAAVRAGAATKFSATEAAQGIEALAKAGVSAEDALSGGLQGALDLAAAGTIDVQVAAEAAAGAMAQFGLNGRDVPHIADLLAAAAGKAQGEVGDMVFALKQSGLVADQVGLSIEETTGALAAFAESSLLGSDAGTSFKAMLGALTPNSEKAAKVMGGLGISAFDAQGKFIGLAEFAGNLQTSLAGLTDQQRQSTLETVFGSDAVRAATILYNQGETGIREWISAVDDQGFAAETAATKMDNLKGDLEQLRGSLETALIGAGDGAQGPLRSLTRGLTDVVNAFNKLPPAAQGTVTSLAGITAVTGGGLWFGSKVVGSVVDTRDALRSLETTAPRTARALSLVGKAAAGLAIITTLDAAIDGLVDSMNDALPGSEEFAGRLLALRDRGVKALGDDLHDLTEVLAYLGTTDQEVGDKLFGWAPNIVGLLPGLQDGEEKTGAFRKELELLDSSLVSITTSGGADRATDAFEALAEAEGLSAEQQKELLSLLPSYKEALAGAANQTKLAGEASGDAAGGIAAVGAAADEATEDVKSLADAFDDLSDGFLDQREAGRNVRDGLRDIQEALKDYRKEHGGLAGAFKEGTESGDEFAGLLDNLAQDYQEQIAATATLSGSQKKTMLVYRESFDELVKVAMQLGMTSEEARKYARRLLGTPKFIKTTFDADTSNAERQISTFLKSIAGLRVVVGVDAKTSKGHAPIARADGGPVSGPGTATSDSIPAMLSNGEHVWTAAEVAAAGGHTAMYAMRAAVRGFANGGAVFASRPAPQQSFAAGGAVAGAASGGTPLIGHATIQPHNYSEFMTQLAGKRALVSAGGEDF